MYGFATGTNFSTGAGMDVCAGKEISDQTLPVQDSTTVVRYLTYRTSLKKISLLGSTSSYSCRCQVSEACFVRFFEYHRHVEVLKKSCPVKSRFV